MGIETDNKGNIHVGQFGRLSPARITVDFEHDDRDGLALDAAETPADNARAGIKLGGFTLAQDPAKDGTATKFGMLDSSGSTVDQWENGVDKRAYALYLDAFNSQIPHAMLPLDSLDGLEDADPEDAVDMANTLATVMIRHFSSLATRYTLGAHLAIDSAAIATLSAVPAATNVATACTLTIAIGTALADHLSQPYDDPHLHFVDDGSYTPSSDLLAGNATEENCLIELAALFSAIFVHLLKAADAEPAVPAHGYNGTLTIDGGDGVFVNGRLMTWTSGG